MKLVQESLNQFEEYKVFGILEAKKDEKEKPEKEEKPKKEDKKSDEKPGKGGFNFMKKGEKKDDKDKDEKPEKEDKKPDDKKSDKKPSKSSKKSSDKDNTVENEERLFKEQEKTGQSIIKKVNDNFNRFKSAAGDKIIKYKEFWDENKESREKFDENGKLYKLFDNTYVVGVLTLPDDALADEKIDSELNDVKNEEKLEESENSKFENSPKEETVDGENLINKNNDNKQETLSNNGILNFVVYNVTDSGREEIFRSKSPTLIKSFEDFYENVLKGTMKEMISKYKEAQEQRKKDEEITRKEAELSKRRAKVDKFLKESKIK